MAQLVKFQTLDFVLGHGLGMVSCSLCSAGAAAALFTVL